MQNNRLADSVDVLAIDGSDWLAVCSSFREQVRVGPDVVRDAGSAVCPDLIVLAGQGRAGEHVRACLAADVACGRWLAWIEANASELFIVEQCLFLVFGIGKSLNAAVWLAVRFLPLKDQIAIQDVVKRKTEAFSVVLEFGTLVVDGCDKIVVFYYDSTVMRWHSEAAKHRHKIVEA